MKHPFIFK